MATRLAIFATHPIQYQTPIWRALSLGSELDVRVFYASDFSLGGYHDRGFNTTLEWDQPLTQGYEHIFLSSHPKRGFFSLTAKGLKPRIKEWLPDVALLCAYYPKFYLDALRLMRRLKVPVILRGELTDVDQQRSLLKQAARNWLLHKIYANVDHFIAIGSNAKKHLRQRNVVEGRISFAGYNIDDGFMLTQAGRWLPMRSDLRIDLSIAQDDFVFLVPGKLLPMKDPLLMVKAFKTLLKGKLAPKIKLLFLGDGPLRESVIDEAGSAYGDDLRVTGFVNQKEIGRYYAIADCVVLPSAFGETWGLVINEAFTFGVPALVSDRVGSAPDLIDEKTGIIFKSGSVASLVEGMRSCMERIMSYKSEMSDACRKKIQHFSVENTAKVVRDAAVTVARASNHNAS